jgi:hypothetical protein
VIALNQNTRSSLEAASDYFKQISPAACRSSRFR